MVNTLAIAVTFRGPCYETTPQLIKQFAHHWHLPCFQYAETWSLPYEMISNYIFPKVSRTIFHQSEMGAVSLAKTNMTQKLWKHNHFPVMVPVRLIIIKLGIITTVSLIRNCAPFHEAILDSQLVSTLLPGQVTPTQVWNTVNHPFTC